MHIWRYNDSPPDIATWLENAAIAHRRNLQTPIKIVGIIGKDYPDHGKGDNINSFLQEGIFPVAPNADEILSIRAHYSSEENILFLMINGLDDVENLKNVFSNPENDGKSFFEKLAESEEKQLKMFHFLFITCHFIILFEQTSRIDLEFFRFLKRVNGARCKLRHSIATQMDKLSLQTRWFSGKSVNKSEREGRFNIPKLLVAFQRNNVKSELAATRKKEIYEKLEKSLDTQLNDVLRSFNLIDADKQSLCQVDLDNPIVHLVNPKVIQRDLLDEMLQYFVKEPEKRQLAHVTQSNMFFTFLEDNFKSEVGMATLGEVIEGLSAIVGLLYGPTDPILTNLYNLHVTFEQRLYREHLNEALRIYEKGYSGPRTPGRQLQYAKLDQVRSKTEHDAKFDEAARYLKMVMGSKVSTAVEELQKRCDELWQSDMRACEQISLTGNRCVQKVHPTFGDTTSSEIKWMAHDSTETLLSTCACGQRQLLRNDPFTLKEANCDFFELSEFTCCRRLEKMQFQVYQEDSEERDNFNIYADQDSNSLNVHTKHKHKELGEELDEFSVAVTSESADSSDLEEELPDTHYSSSSSDDLYMRPTSRKDLSTLTKSNRDLAIEYANRLKKLKASEKIEECIEGVPNTLTQGKLPLFPSFILTCLGDSSLYNHSSGVRSQPNFKIGGEYLVPVVVTMNVDIDTWNRDVDKIRAEEYNRKFMAKTKKTDEVARVKLFIGFEYECNRGHRFFVDPSGEPLVFPKGSARDAIRRGSLNDLLDANLPLRRACTCRKQPLKTAQLMKVHVVTPRAPVEVTINPQIEVPGHEGVYNTGQPPLHMKNSKYYILQLPSVYSGPSGTYIHDATNLNKIGTFKGGSIRVTYKPVLSFRW